jgi:hypothetical protein
LEPFDEDFFLSFGFAINFEMEPPLDDLSQDEEVSLVQIVAELLCDLTPCETFLVVEVSES